MPSKGVRPALPPVQNPQNFNGIAAHAVGRNVGRTADDQLASPWSPASPSGELQQAGDGCDETLDLAVGCRWIVPRDVIPARLKVDPCPVPIGD
jgi:hypothetical protein